MEEGKLVDRVSTFTVHAGDAHCVDPIHANAPMSESEVAANLAQLSAEDAEAAALQHFCAVQDNVRLGTMGVPTKIMLKGKAVFLCCPGCADAARSHADKVLNNAKNLREKATLDVE
jgi:hypothetical protein